MSAHTGEFDFEIKGKKLTIIYDWSALSELSEINGAVHELGKPVDKVNPHIVADVMACGLKKHHPEMTKEAIIEWSPPLVRSILVLDKALSYAYYGVDGVPKADNKKKVKKKTILQRLFPSV